MDSVKSQLIYALLGVASTFTWTVIVILAAPVLIGLIALAALVSFVIELETAMHAELTRG